jgi:hypothetical protein
VNKKTSNDKKNIKFGNAHIVISKTIEPLNHLKAIDQIWALETSPPCRFDLLDENFLKIKGFHIGLFLDGEEKNKFHTLFTKISDSIYDDTNPIIILRNLRRRQVMNRLFSLQAKKTIEISNAKDLFQRFEELKELKEYEKYIA